MEIDGGAPPPAENPPPRPPTTPGAPSPETRPRPPDPASGASAAAAVSRDGSDDCRSLRDLLLIASLTDVELLGRILADVKKRPGNEWGIARTVSKRAAEDFLRTRCGHDAFLKLALGASKGGFLPSTWSDIFADALGRSTEGGRGGSQAKEDPGPVSVRAVASQLPPDGHRTRLVLALGRIRDIRQRGTTASLPSGSLTPSVREAVGTLRGSALVGDSAADLQSEALAVLLSVLAQANPAGGQLSVFGAVQVPLLRRLEWTVLGGGFPPETARLARTLLDLGSGGGDENRREFSDADGADGVGNDDKIGLPPSGLNVEADDLDEDALLTTRFVQAAELARNGDQRGAKHGCILCVPSGRRDERGLGRVIGRGWNHNVLIPPSDPKRSGSGTGRGKGAKGERRRKSGKSKLVLHAEVHAVADALRRHGESSCFADLFPRATAVTVELDGDHAYGNARPCPNCHTQLLGCGVVRALHSTAKGTIEGPVALGRAREVLLTRDRARVPLRAACDEIGVRCERLEWAEERAIGGAESED